MIPNSHRNIATAALLVAATCQALAQQTPVNEGQIVEALRSGTMEQRYEALAAIREVAPANRSSALLRSLLAELDREAGVVEGLWAAQQSGEYVKPAVNTAEYELQLLQLVCQHDDPIIIKSLLPFIGSGNMVVNRLANFGDRVVPEVVGIAAAPVEAQSPGNVAGALLVLERILQRDTGRRLSSASREAIVAVAKQRLSGMQPDYIVFAAVTLAAFTEDPELLGRVKALANSQAAVRDLGIAEPRLIAMVQKRANEALALAASTSRR